MPPSVTIRLTVPIGILSVGRDADVERLPRDLTFAERPGEGSVEGLDDLRARRLGGDLLRSRTGRQVKWLTQQRDGIASGKSAGRDAARHVPGSDDRDVQENGCALALMWAPHGAGVAGKPLNGRPGSSPVFLVLGGRRRRRASPTRQRPTTRTRKGTLDDGAEAPGEPGARHLFVTFLRASPADRC
jgi:hypothetical protein